MPTSPYDKLHDELFVSASKKAGTRYERLAAIVMKVMNEGQRVVHDLNLVGDDTGCKHQIDVTVEDPDGHKRRVLVECKDFGDTSGKKVGIGIVRDFWGVVGDIHPDEAIIVSTQGFTKGARKFAKARGIKLALLRRFRDNDWDDRLKRIDVQMHVQHINLIHTHLGMTKEHAQLGIETARALGISWNGWGRTDPVYIDCAGEVTPINAFFQHHVNAVDRQQTGNREVNLMQTPSFLVVGSIRIPLYRLSIEVDVWHETVQFDVAAEGVAKLIWDPLDTEGDLIVYDGELRSYAVDEHTGEVIGAEDLENTQEE